MKSQSKNIHKHTIDGSCQFEDSIAIESPLEIRLGYDKGHFQTLAITLCSPDDCEDLIYGYLFTEGIISNKSDVIGFSLFDNELGLIAEIILVKSIDYEKSLNKRQGMIHASCGICGKTQIDDLLTFNYVPLEKNNPRINSKTICSLPEKLRLTQKAFVQTGGIHASALFDKEGHLMCIREDIGRHNALDKLIGYCLKNKLLPLSDKIILLSGRVSFELVHKSLCSGVSTLAAIGAPSSLSIEVAQLNYLQLLGFVKKSGFNRYV